MCPEQTKSLPPLTVRGRHGRSNSGLTPGATFGQALRAYTSMRYPLKTKNPFRALILAMRASNSASSMWKLVRRSRVWEQVRGKARYGWEAHKRTKVRRKGKVSDLDLLNYLNTEQNRKHRKNNRFNPSPQEEVDDDDLVL